MTGTITYRDGVAIGVLVAYVPILAMAILLCIRHGISRSAGWRFMVVFALARILGSAFQLCTINDPNDTTWYIAYAILINIAISPLMLTSLGLLSRLLNSINKTRETWLTSKHIKLIELVMLVSLILGIVGGVDANETLAKTGVYQPQTLSKASIGLVIPVYVAIVAICVLLFFSISAAEPRERRILAAVVVSLPFMLCRIIYSALTVFTHSKHFNTVTGDVTVLLCMALLEELVISAIYVGVGLTLNRFEQLPPVREGQVAEGVEMEPSKV